MFAFFDQNLTIYTVFYKESESEVKKSKMLDPGGEKLEKLFLNPFFLIFPYIFIGEYRKIIGNIRKYKGARPPPAPPCIFLCFPMIFLYFPVIKCFRVPPSRNKPKSKKTKNQIN